MKVVIGAIALVILATILIFKAVDSGKEDGVTMDAYIDSYFSLIQLEDYGESYEMFHEDLKQSISREEYEAAWKERIEKFGPLLSWKIHTANKSYNLFSSETEYNVIIHLRFGPDKVIAAVRQDWKVEGDTVKLIWTGSAKGFIEAY